MMLREAMCTCYKYVCALRQNKKKTLERLKQDGAKLRYCIKTKSKRKNKKNKELMSNKMRHLDYEMEFFGKIHTKDNDLQYVTRVCVPFLRSLLSKLPLLIILIEHLFEILR